MTDVPQEFDPAQVEAAKAAELAAELEHHRNRGVLLHVHLIQAQGEVEGLKRHVADLEQKLAERDVVGDTVPEKPKTTRKKA